MKRTITMLIAGRFKIFTKTVNQCLAFLGELFKRNHVGTKAYLRNFYDVVIVKRLIRLSSNNMNSTFINILGHIYIYT